MRSSSNSWSILISIISGKCVSNICWKWTYSLERPYFEIRVLRRTIISGYSTCHSVCFAIGLSAMAALAALRNFLTCPSTVFPLCIYGKLV